MKISKIKIKDFYQFKNLELDLTYPKGHPKAGKPLDKVCIIGQSGTGKTTLLKLISGHTFTLNTLLQDYDSTILDGVRIVRNIGDLEITTGIEHNKETNVRSYNWKDQYLAGKKIKFDEGINYFTENIEQIKTRHIFFPADLKYEYEDYSNIPDLAEIKIIDFRKKISSVWKLVFNEIQKFQEEEIKLKQEIAKVAVEDGSDTIKIQKAVRKLEIWKKKAVNPIHKVADECLDEVLKHLNLKVKRDFNFETKSDIGLVKLQDLKNIDVPYNLLSTGTKQLLLTALPLYLLKPENCLICVDEPERSLYPSMQKFVIDYYQSFTKDSQIIYATHSPIIASDFEPWEIIELKFNDGFVVQDLYYPKDKERHVDNYTIIPSYLTYDLMLSKVFDLQETHSQERSEKITEVLMLRNQLKVLKEKNKLSTKQGKLIEDKYNKLSAQLFWDFDFVGK